MHVTDDVAIRALWEHGFFGKGSLSRSEPTWLDREKRRLGVLATETSEEVTRKRREERKEFKRERAWREKAAIEEARRKERQALEDQKAPEPLKGEVEQFDPPAMNAAIERSEDSPTGPKESNKNRIMTLPSRQESQTPKDDTIASQEHMQLNLEEALFLTLGLGVLDIFSNAEKRVVSLKDILPLFASYATFPPQTVSITAPLSPDNQLLISYVAYHHFRSLGWVVRPGIKFAVDLLLYNRGPVFAHAEFAVIVLPDYTHPVWMERGEAKQKPWHWLHMVNRVQSQVRKTLILCYVHVPPPLAGEAWGDVDFKALLERYQVREVVLKRWIPNRSRD